MPPLEEGLDYYWDGDLMVFTAAYHLKRGSCCQSGCRHCPYGDRKDAESDLAPNNDARQKEKGS